MKLPSLKSWSTAVLSLAAAGASHAAVLVNLDAAALTPGNLATWPNTGTATGDFASSGTAQPVVQTVGLVQAVTFNGGANFMTGPAAPATVTGTTKARSVEAWAYNPTIQDEETMIAWGRRGGPDGTDMSFGYGANAVFGAVGQWGVYDLAYGSGLPSPAQWHHLVYTYDGAIGRIYVDGGIVNEKIIGQTNVYALDGQATPQPLKFVVAGQGNNVTPFLPFAAGTSFQATLSVAKVRVHDTTLSPAAISSTFAAEFPTFNVPAINSFTTSASSVLPGQSVTLSFSTGNATSVSINNGVGSVALGASSVVVTPPTGGATYTLTATKGAQTLTASVVITNPAVSSALPPLLHRWSFNESNAGGAADTNCVDSVGATHGLSSGAQNAIIKGTYNATVGTASAWTRATNVGTAAGTAGVRLGGGASASSAYIDLPNNVMSALTQVTFEGWMTLNGAQTWSRLIDLGTNTNGEQIAVGGAGNGTEYMLVSAQVGTTTTSRRIAMKDNNVEVYSDVTGLAVSYGTQFHFAGVYDPLGNAGVSPTFKFYQDGVLKGTLNTAFRPQDLVFVNNWLGRSNFGGDANTNGTYNEFRIWSIPMTQAQITASIAAGPDGTPPSPDVTVSQFVTSATTIYKGSPVNLSYQIADPQARNPTISINNGATVPSATSLINFATVSPLATTTYTITASYTVSGTPTTQTATVTVTVLDGPPVALATGACTPAGAPIAVPFIVQDPNSTAFTYTIVAGPTNGILSGTGNSRTYTPNAGYSGTDTFTYTANDGLTTSNIATATITVLPAPPALLTVTVDDNELRTNTAVGSYAGRLMGSAGTTLAPLSVPSVTWSLVAGTGDTNNGYFSIVNNQLISNHDFSADLGVTISIRLRGVDVLGNTVDKIVTSKVKAPDVHVKINEINYNGARNTQRVEFIELYNPFPTAVAIAGWQFTKGVSYTFPTGASIAANGYVVICEDPVTLNGLYNIPAASTVFGPWAGSLSSDGDDIVLKDPTGTKIDEVQFGITAPWPAQPDGNGNTLELLNPAVDNDLGGHWAASANNPAAMSLVPMGDTNWKYFKGTVAADTGWQANNYADTGAAWLVGQTPIGLFKINNNTAATYSPENGTLLNTVLSDMATYAAAPTTAAQDSFPIVAGNYRTVYFRKAFTVADVSALPKALLLRVMHDDAAVVWINGVEVARFGFPDGSPAQPPLNTQSIYEQANYPWSELVIANPASIIVNGSNTIAIQGHSKNGAPRVTSTVVNGTAPGTQEDFGSYNVFDFCVDASLGSVPETQGTPGLQNSTFAAKVPPAIRNVEHLPVAPKSFEPIIVSAKVSDSDGLASVTLAYQVCTAGNYIPGKSSLLPSAVTATRIDWALQNIDNKMPDNPAFEDPANWTTIPMSDNGTVKGDIAGDGVFSAVIPAQPHRALVRYRVFATDLLGANVRVPGNKDPRKNYAAYVYNAVPAYLGVNGENITPSTLNSLPIYQMISRASDWDRMIAYNTADQFANSIELTALRARKFFDESGTMVYNGKVYDHTETRLRGGNSRYGSFAPAPGTNVGKRHLRIRFPNGLPFEAKDEKGRPYPRPWKEMMFNKMFGNKGVYDYGIPYEVGARLWRLTGLPMPESHWVHFRVVRNANETQDPVNGDFYGMYQALEFPDGKDFLKARGLEAGNFYKMSDWTQNGELDQRYQARGWFDAAQTFHPAVDFGEDFDNIKYNVHQTASNALVNRYVDVNAFYGYKIIQEAIRHYDIFVEPTGRHRMKNLIWYFKPTPNDLTNKFGQLVHMPYDWDASFGPTFNTGTDLIHNALFDGTQGYTGVDITDSPSWLLPKNSTTNDTDRTAIRIEYRNRMRELRDLLLYRDAAATTGPFDDMVNDALADVGTFWPADKARWPVTGAQLENVNGAVFKAGDMKNFMFTTWSDSLTSGPAVPAGGRVAYLDTLADTTLSPVNAGGVAESTLIPSKPTITYTGAAGYPLDGLAFSTSAFVDPQGNTTQGALEWRIAEVAAPTATTDRVYEYTPVWSTSITTWNGTAVSQQFPIVNLIAGHNYKARVRHKDVTGRASHWSDPVAFTAGPADALGILASNLIVSELMYKPAPPTSADLAAGWGESDFEYIELQNISPSLTLDISSVKIALAVTYSFTGAAITTLSPGQRVLVVKNTAAFASRYGAGKPVAGVWKSSQSLSNGGEQFQLLYGAAGLLRDFTYDDLSPWPAGADSGGISLVYIGPKPTAPPTLALPDPQNTGTNWRASYTLGGSPGGKDTLSLAEWMAARGQTDPLADPDGDGFNNCLTFAFGHDLRPFGISAATDEIDGAGKHYLSMDYTRRIGTEAVTYTAQVSGDLTAGSWAGTSAQTQQVSVINNGDGTETVRVKVLIAIPDGIREFLRVQALHN